MMYTRKPNRLREFDYANNRSYFVTICAHKKFDLFGRIIGGEMHLNEIGAIVADRVKKISESYEGVTVASSVVMPNHVHIIIKNSHGG